MVLENDTVVQKFYRTSTLPSMCISEFRQTHSSICWVACLYDHSDFMHLESCVELINMFNHF